MNFHFAVRLVLGLVFAVIGQQVAARFVTVPDPNLHLLITGISIIIFGAIGVFIVPIISVSIRTWTANFARGVANEVISQLRLPRLNRSRKTKEKEKDVYTNPVVVDTSALIDGRISDMIESGFMNGTLVVPRFVLSELHHIADAPDALRRGKGRRGLEVLESLKKSKWVKTVIYTGKIEQEKEIDNKLIVLAKMLRAKILTTDFNLNKVATVSGIKILNINELVNALKTTLLPGESLQVKVIQEGKEKTQGVGYLPDGTMIVVENGSVFVGKTIPTTVSRVLQTAAGRMIFTQPTKTEEKHPA